MMTNCLKTTQIFATNINVGRRQELSTQLINIVREGPNSIFFCNVHMLMLAQKDDVLAAAMKAADLVMPDGVPIAWLQQRLGNSGAAVLRGYEAVNILCAQAAVSGKPVGFLGSTEAVLEALSENLRQQHQGLKVGYLYAPPLMSDKFEVDSCLVKEINSYNLHYLFIGLGCPKQEKWIARYSPDLNCSVLAVGAAFDWMSGVSKKPPDWVENIGAAWLYRLMQDPRRMWRRYLVYNSLFVIKTMKLLFWDRPLANLFGRNPQ